jgi:DNA (cytosine-5)-methyltransferase 1
MSRPKMLDTFGGAGGAAWGYWLAGFDVFGVEMDPNRAARYPFPVHVGDALVALRTLNAGGKVDFVLPEGRRKVKDSKGRTIGLAGTVVWLGWEDFFGAHGSPPCQGYTRGNAGKVTAWPKLIPDVRALFVESGKPYVIENVKDAGSEMVGPTYLCGCMFDLTAVDDDGITLHLQRPRLFETSFPLEAPRACDHSGHEWVAGAYGGARRDKYEAKFVRKGGYVPPNKAVVAALLGIEHPMSWDELFESIPPAYTAWVGAQLLAALTTQEMAA